MKILKAMAISAAGAAAMMGAAFASDVEPCPDEYREMAASYIESRMEDPRGARIQFIGDPYMVSADFSGRSDLVGWGVDVRVRSRLASGAYGGYASYTILFIDGGPVAFEDEAQSVTRI